MPPRQEVYNVVLAQLLQKRGLVVAPKEVLSRRSAPTRLPDVIVDFQGLRLIIEAEIGRNRWQKAYEKAQERVAQGIAHVGVAVVYPTSLRDAAFDRLAQAIEVSTLQYAIVTEAAVGDTQMELFPNGASAGPSQGTVDDLADLLRRSYEQLVRDETLNRAVAMLEASMERFLYSLRTQPATATRLAAAIGITELPPRGKKDRSSRQLVAVSRIAALIALNALIFQEVLSRTESRVRPLRAFRHSPQVIADVIDQWELILEEINYFPIFYTALGILQCISAEANVSQSVHDLLDTAAKTVDWKASLRHDLAGRIYHRLLEESKFLGAYYTSIPTATLLLKLALPLTQGGNGWSNLDFVGAFKMADLACGTGTLLMAAVDAMLDNHVRTSVARARAPNVDALHDVLIEKTVHGYDVLASALHLTASTLTLRTPDRPTNVTNLYRLPLGGEDAALGTLEFLESPVILGTLFGKPEQIGGKKAVARQSVTLPQFDLCAMNPPFTRSVGGNLLFGNLPDAERSRMQAKLKRQVANGKLEASVTAGLGAVFVALADKHLKPGGRLALVLPRALMSGVAWQRTRDLVNRDYLLEYLIVSHEPNHWNFSENTELSEVLTIARKRDPSESADAPHSCTCMNLWRQPRNAIEALGLVRSVLDGRPARLESDDAPQDLTIAGKKVGEAVSVAWSELRQGMWSFPCSFAQTELVRAFYALRNGDLHLPQSRRSDPIPLCELHELGQVGFDRRDMHDAFNVVNDVTDYPAVWGHDCERLTTLKCEANRYLQPLVAPKTGRPSRDALHLWGRSSRLLIAERLWLQTMRVAAVRPKEKVLSNVLWNFVLQAKDSAEQEQAEKCLVLWLNSTPGLLLLLGHREETRGAWIDFKKPVLHRLPVLDVRAIGADVRERLAREYDRLEKKELHPFPFMGEDKTRAAIDDAISQAAHLPNLSSLRRLLAREPILSFDLRTILPQVWD